MRNAENKKRTTQRVNWLAGG